MRSIVTVILFACTVSVAQVSDDFSDGDFVHNPQWKGDTSKFRVWNQRLQLFAAPQSGQASLVFVNRVISSARWEFDLELGFNPSSSNLSRFYMVADTADLSGPVHGYYVQIGSTGDDVSLYRQDGGMRHLLVDGTDGRVNLSVVRIRIAVETDEDGTWTLFTNVGASGVWTTEGSAQDVTYTASRYTGWFCLYTSTRCDKFYLDDVRTSGTLFPDIIRPEITSAQIQDSTTVVIRFSEAMDMQSVSDLSHYQPSPDLVERLDEAGILLRLSDPLKDGQYFTLGVSGPGDLAGNVIRDTVVVLPWVVPRKAYVKDIIIHEIMADPVPPVDLPDAEYVEIFNRSGHPFNLSGWKLTDGTSTAILPVTILAPDSRITLCPFTTGGDFAGLRVAGFPSLNNSGDRLKLIDPNGQVIDSVDYSSSWHTVSGKAEGGWSLELIDPRNFCHDKSNWASSEDPSGGTPGRENSVLASKPDITGPKFITAQVVDSLRVLLGLSEPVTAESLLSATFDFNPTLDLTSLQLQPERNMLMAGFADTLHTGIFYTLRSGGLRDCPGNLMNDDGGRIRFMRAHEPDTMDVVINEIMFDPLPGEGDYVELWNRTGKYFQLRNWRAGRAVADSVYDFRPLTAHLLGPGGYAVLTEDRTMMKMNWPDVPDSVMVEADLPSLPDDEGGFVLMGPLERLLDVFHYQRSYHSPLVKNEEGIALERLDPWVHTDDPANWRSAAGARGTPGYRNSCRVDSGTSGSRVWTDPPVASTADAFIRIMYSFGEDGWFAHARVFDLAGNEVKTLANGESLATAGFLRWDLDDGFGRHVWPGIYLAVVDVYRPGGMRRLYRRRMVVTR